MAETISRALRDGTLEGEHPPALTIEDSLRCPLGSLVFDHFLSTLASHICAGKSQAKGLVLVALNRSPSSYSDLLKRKGLDTTFLERSVQILDCYSDPLGWKDRILHSQGVESLSLKDPGTTFRDVRDVDKLSSAIIDLGTGFTGESNARFAVAIDSVSNMLRHASLPSVASLLNNLRSNEKVSCIFWLMHSDLHEPRVSTALEYISSMIASLDPMIHSTDGQRSAENLLFLEQNSHKAKFHVRLKRRNGRVKQFQEELRMEQVAIKFASVSSESTIINQNLLPKVQFNLQLSDRERADRANVVLPFEHQGNGEPIQIYDGRRSLSEGQKDPHFVRPSASSQELDSQTSHDKGEIHYIRDSDDEQPDSDEDPDDDLDI